MSDWTGTGRLSLAGWAWEEPQGMAGKTNMKWVYAVK